VVSVTTKIPLQLFVGRTALDRSKSGGDELLDGSGVTATGVLALDTVLPVLDCGVTTNTLLLAKSLLHSAINVEDSNAFDFFFSPFSAFFPSGLHTGAVTSPWREEFYDGILCADLLVEVLRVERFDCHAVADAECGEQSAEHCG